MSEFPDATTTVYDLLSHARRLPDYDAFDALLRSGQAGHDARDAGRSPDGLDRPPAPRRRTRFTYCNLCLDAAALVVERVTGKRFEQVLRQQFFAPLGIDDAFIRPARLAAMPADRAVGYRIRDGRRERFDAEDFEGFYGGGNLYASARDFARFARAFATCRRSDPRCALSATRTVARCMPPGDLGSGLTLGSWYCATGGERCYYTGVASRLLQRDVLRIARQRLVVVYVSNSTIAPWLQPRITRELVAAAEGRQPASPVEPKLVALTPEVLRSAAATYDVPGAGRVVLVDDKDTTYVRAGAGGGVEFRLFRVSPTLLYGPGLDAFVGIGGDGRLSWTTGFIESFGTRLR